MIVDLDVEKSHLSGKEKQIPISYMKLNMLVGIHPSKQEGNMKLPEGRLCSKTEIARPNSRIKSLPHCFLSEILPRTVQISSYSESWPKLTETSYS